MATGSAREEPPLVVVVGPTASGKTALAIRLARRFNGEVICADSRTVYRDMNIGTAKPTPEERAQVPHWGLDLVQPGEYFTAADFKVYALQKIDEIRKRGHVPFLVGGTGLYIDGVVFDYQFGVLADENERERLENLTIEQLHDYCIKNNMELPENRYNKRYVIRAIEQKSINTKRRSDPINNSLIVGITTEKEILRKRIADRTEQLFDNDVVEEATLLGEKYGWESRGMTGNIYPLVRSYLAEELTYNEMKEKSTTLDWRLAKRQQTWWRRNPYIYWGSVEELYSFVAEELAKR